MKVIVAAATPVLVVLLGVLVARTARRIEQAQWADRRLIERRLELYDDMAGRLNDLYCFFSFVGNFREIEPPMAVKLKRELDKTFHVNRFLMSAEFGRLYEQFMETCFETWIGVGEDAKLRSDVEWHRQERRDWDASWDRCFVSGDKVSEIEEVAASYQRLMVCFASLLGVADEAGSKALAAT